MTDRDHFRDEGLGTALRELEVPEHRPEFDRELEAMLARPGATGAFHSAPLWGLQRPSRSSSFWSASRARAPTRRSLRRRRRSQVH